MEKTRASEAIFIVKSLANAQERYLLENGTYTDDMALLDITIPGEASSVAGGQNRVFTGLFDYGVRGTTIIAVSNRLPAQTKYAIIYTPAKKLFCATFVQQYNSICQAVGGKTADATTDCLNSGYTGCYELKF